MPSVVDLGRYSMLNYSAWPNIAEITRGSLLSWYNKVPDVHEQQHIDARLDNQYVQMMWNSANEVKGEIRENVVNFFKKDFVMTNVIWALRLKVYYEMKSDDIIGLLACSGNKPLRSDPLCGPAIDILDKAVDSYADWEQWQYAKFLNPHEEGAIWKIDPRWVENAYKAGMYKHAEKLFHANPMTDMSLIAWFKIKQHECDIIRTAAEGIRLNVETAEAMKIAGVAASAE